MKALLLEKDIPAQEVATSLMEVVPLVMAKIRTEMRRYRPADLSIPQFRVLNFVRRYPNTSLSPVAEHVGLTLPSVSKMVDGLQERGLLRREIDPQNRRKMTLNLTEAGQATLKAVREATLPQLTQKLAQLSESEQATVAQALELLRPLFGLEMPNESTEIAQDEEETE
jgi:MarR family transcriptional regulator for hemolysin